MKTTVAKKFSTFGILVFLFSIIFILFLLKNFFLSASKFTIDEKINDQFEKNISTPQNKEKDNIKINKPSEIYVGDQKTAEEDLKNVPIDVVYKYIDLRDKKLDPKLHKKSSKDTENSEIKYSIRSVLKNIPWVRKIFVVMPNEKIKYFKDPIEIKDKIVYVKDKDLVGFDGRSSVVFEFNLWRLKDFGCSENFIYFNDDFFVGEPLEKSDFFYKKDGRIVPFTLYSHCITNKPYMYEAIHNKCRFYQLKTGNSNIQNSNYYFRRVIQGYVLIYKIFDKKDIWLPKYPEQTTHNAKPFLLSDIKEAYDIIEKNYEESDDCLRARSPTKNQIIMQTFTDFYFLNKEKRLIKNLDNGYFQITTLEEDINLNLDLFCINTGEEVVSKEMADRAIRIMENKFPQKTIYEN
ncbi:MAG: hypothetical protein LBI55_00370 [Oscillospiraceae bacterium]|jgi:hypothetical protein|nr:hypothetical protein [Oscillospiraceae bacterium]